MLETSARLLRLLSVLSSRPAWTGPELATRLKITDRTLRRDVAKLRSLGYPVTATPGMTGGYRLGSGTSTPPLMLDDDEAVAVALSLRTAAAHTVSGVGEASLRALAKLEQVLPSRLRSRARIIGQATEPLTGPEPTVDADTLATIALACRTPERLTFAYRTRDGADGYRRVEPHRLVQAGYRWYLVARDTDHGEWRTYRVDRITDPRPSGHRFVPQDPPDAAAFVARQVSVSPYRYRAEILLHEPRASVARRLPPTVGVLTDAGSDECLLVTGADSPYLILFHLAGLECEFTIRSPPELADAARVAADRLSRAIDTSE